MVGRKGSDTGLEVILVLRREAEGDILEAFRWYESKRAGLGTLFVDEVDAAFERVTEAPHSFPLAYGELRRLVMKRFPLSSSRAGAASKRSVPSLASAST